MNLCLEPNKCKSLSICSGLSKVVEFKLSEMSIGSILNSPEKFLGSYITYHGKQSETFNIVSDSICAILENIDKCLIADEYKLKVYSQYLLPAIRFKLSVHEITTTNLSKLDAIGDRFIKKWLGMPQSGTMAIAHSKEGLHIKSFSQIYKESHAISHATSRVKADSVVNIALDQKVQREQSWTRKSSISVYCEDHYTNVISSVPQSESQVKHLENVKTKVKNNIADEFVEMWHTHIKTLCVQGRFLEILAMENAHVTWKSIIYNLPRGVLKFAINASIDTLPTNANLKRWGKRSNAKCNLCKARETLHHTLNNCQEMLDRYLWRHNSIISYLYKVIKSDLAPSFQIYADIPGYHQGISTIPTDILITNLKPDMVIINRQNKTLILFELSVPFETNIDSTHSYKIDRYLTLIADIEDTGYKVKYYPIEIGSRGYISKDNISRFRSLSKDTNVHLHHRTTKDCLCKISLVCSYIIFHAKYDASWINPPYVIF